VSSVGVKLLTLIDNLTRYGTAKQEASWQLHQQLGLVWFSLGVAHFSRKLISQRCDIILLIKNEKRGIELYV